jgi:glutaredoxin
MEKQVTAVVSDDSKSWEPYNLTTMDDVIKTIGVPKRYVQIRFINQKGKDTIPLHVFCKTHCPFTRNTVRQLMNSNENFLLIIHNIDTHPYLKNRLNEYRKKRKFGTSYPQIFYKGKPLGGSDEFLSKLK